MSTPKIHKYGDKGQPCLTPLLISNCGVVQPVLKNCTTCMYIFIKQVHVYPCSEVGPEPI